MCKQYRKCKFRLQTGWPWQPFPKSAWTVCTALGVSKKEVIHPLTMCIFSWHAWVQGGPCWCQDASCNDNMYIVSYNLHSEGVDGYNGWVHWDQSSVTRDCEDNLQGANCHQQGAPCKYTLPDCTLLVTICTLGLHLVGNIDTIGRQWH